MSEILVMTLAYARPPARTVFEFGVKNSVG